MSDRFTEKAENALNRSVKIAEKLGHTYIGSEHLLLALSEDEASCAALILKKNSVSKDKIYICIKEYSGIGVKSTLSSKDLTPRARKILESSYNNANQYGDGTIGTEHILLSLVEEKDCVATKLLKNMRVDTNSIREDIYTLTKSRERAMQKTKREGLAPILKQYGRNLCELAKEGKFDPVIGRDKETNRLIRVLSRKNKNNPCLIGEAGVGKTAIVEGLAQKIVNNEVPPALCGKIIISVDLTSMVAGAKYRGDFEDRIKNIINEVVKHKDIILFIDEIHTIVGAGAAEGAIDASNILKPQLARGDVQVIGATTYDEYRKYIEKDAALERRFQPIQVQEPSEDETIKMMIALKSRYEDHHGVKIEDAAINECVVLSSKYISDRFLPDKAIDVLDEACAMISSKIANIKKTEQISEQFDYATKNAKTDIVDFKPIYQAEYPVILTAEKSNSSLIVTPEIIKNIISESCDIPVSMIKKSVNYEELKENLKHAIIGQDEAIDQLVSAIRRSELGFLTEERPRGIFMFVGASGIGKTALAIELEKNLFYNSSNLLRFDMSEYSERQSISKLIGSPPGYVGYDEGGTLTEAVKRKPNAIILFDEIEKADKEILNLLLQISDYGYLRDSVGKHINFRNTIVIATTNIGSSQTIEKVGFTSDIPKRSIAETIEALKKHFKEELLNRFDEIILFSPLSDSTIKKIITRRLAELSASLIKRGYELTFDEKIIDAIASKGKIKGLGARPILRLISTEIEDRIIDFIANNDNNARIIEIVADDGNITISNKEALIT